VVSDFTRVGVIIVAPMVLVNAQKIIEKNVHVWICIQKSRRNMKIEKIKKETYDIVLTMSEEEYDQIKHLIATNSDDIKTLSIREIKVPKGSPRWGLVVRSLAVV
jgi:tryptophan 2,3-dioxygenase